MDELTRQRGNGSLDFCSLEELGGRAHVLVDGAEREGSALTLSHWPGSPTPRVLWRDLSVEIVLAYLAYDGPLERWASGSQARPGEPAEVATIDHLDVDGLLALYALVEPEAALERAALLSSVARVGDFDDATSPVAAKLAFGLRSLLDTQRSETGAGGSGTSSTHELLPRLSGLLDHPDHLDDRAGPELATFTLGRRAIASGAVRVVEHDDLGLAVVELERGFEGAGTRLESGAELGIHPAAIHGVTALGRVLVVGEENVVYYDRYETWVRYMSRRFPMRRDLGPLASLLSAEEPRHCAWRADPPSALRPVLAPGAGATSGLRPKGIVEMVKRYLGAAPPAFDPFAQGRPLLIGGPQPFSGPEAPRSGTIGRALARSRDLRRARL